MGYTRVASLAASLGLATLSGCALELDYGSPRDGGADVGDTGLGALDAGPRVDSGADAIVGDVGADVGPVACVTTMDCMTARGAPPCGAWQCSAAFTCGVVCPNCMDADLDGYGIGPGCAGLDCNDMDPTITTSAMRSCYPFSPGTTGVGACHAGVEMCTGGVWGGCAGAQGPTPESCNGVDDDCNTVVDDGFGMIACGLGVCRTTTNVCTNGRLSACVPGRPVSSIDGCGNGDEDCDGVIDEDCTNCVWVSTSGSDTSPDPRVVATPYATVQAAIDLAAMDPTFSVHVCLLSNGCSTSPASFVGPVTMANGVYVIGNWAPGGAAQCPTNWHTEIRSPDATGVLFDSTIQRHTQLADVMITPAQTPTSAGVTVSGAQTAMLADVLIVASADVTNAYGVDVRDSGSALIIGSTIYAGRGSNEGIGVRVAGAQAIIQNNCGGPLDAAGRCTSGCGNANAPGIRGRQDTNGARAATSYAILLRDAPGSVVEASSTCGEMGNESAGIRIDGPANGTIVRGNFVAGWGGQNASYGIDLADCSGHSPLIVDNAQINAEAPQSSPDVAIRSLGACHPIIQGNQLVVSGLEGSANSTAILCGAGAGGVSSRCVIEGNLAIHAAISGNPLLATGVACQQDGCARIVQNEISGTQGAMLVGLSLATSHALVARNRISGGCASGSAIGVLAANSRARLENNVVLGAGPCASSTILPSAPRFVGLAASATDVTYVLDVHGNDFDPGGASSAGGAPCSSRGIELTGRSGVHVGLLRGDIVLAGSCLSAYPIVEVDANSDPIALEHCDLFPRSGGPVYRDQGTTDIPTAALVNALGDAVLTMNVDTPPGFVSYPADLHLAAGSMCIDQDTSMGAPIDDLDGRTRTPPPDIGAYEH